MRLAAQTCETCHEISDFVMTDVVMSWQMSWSVWWTISTKMSTNCLRHTLSVDTLWQVKSCPKKLIPSDELWVGYPGEPWWKSWFSLARLEHQTVSDAKHMWKGKLCWGWEIAGLSTTVFGHFRVVARSSID
jgi:hypothetical protein